MLVFGGIPSFKICNIFRILLPRHFFRVDDLKLPAFSKKMMCLFPDFSWDILVSRRVVGACRPNILVIKTWLVKDLFTICMLREAY